MSRQHRRKVEKAKRHSPSAPKPSGSAVTRARHAPEVERLAYTRTQAAEALGVSRTTFSRRVLPLLETIDMPWGPRLVPVDELERFVRERRRPARGGAPRQRLRDDRPSSQTSSCCTFRRSMRRARACVRSPATSTPPRRRRRTAGRGGCPRLCARFCADLRVTVAVSGLSACPWAEFATAQHVNA